MSFSASSLHKKLTSPASVFGIQLWVLILICIALLLLFLCFFCLLISYLCPRRASYGTSHGPQKSAASSDNFRQRFSASSSLDRRLLSRNASEMEMRAGGAGHRQLSVTGWSRTLCRSNRSDIALNLNSIASRLAVLSDPKCGNCYTFEDIRVATNGFAAENVMGSDGCGIVYRGVLPDNTSVAIRILPSCEAEELKVELRAVGHARHRNLVELLGYCVEDQRMLVHEYVANGNLHRWLHRWTGPISPLTWDRRMKIIIGIAKGLAYLHEDIEPMVVHQNLRSSNILIDHQWIPKITDFGFAKIFGKELRHVITRTKTTSGYVAPEYASTGVLTEKSDVYSFGVLVMELVSGRTPIDYSRSQAYLVDWLKSLVASQEFDLVLDPKLRAAPCLKELKRIILIALRCADPEVEARPAMGEVIHMLEPRDLLLTGDQQIRRADSYRDFLEEN